MVIEIPDDLVQRFRDTLRILQPNDTDADLDEQIQEVVLKGFEFGITAARERAAEQLDRASAALRRDPSHKIN